MLDLLRTVTAPVLLLLLGAPVAAAPPAVVTLSPDHGATGVDPALGELRVEFDRDMGPDVSWTGGPMAPAIAGPPRWEGPRVCVLPVRLEPGREYQMSLNSLNHRGFASRAGETLQPVPLWFRTAAPESEPSGPDPRGRASFQTLRRAIEQRYSYRDRLGIDWEAAFRDAEPGLVEADSPFQFAARASRMLAVAQDAHVSVVVESGTLPTWTRLVEPNMNFPFVASQLRDFRQRSPSVFSGRLDDRIGYICIATWEAGAAAQIEPAFEALDDLSSLPALIIDVRANGGGDERIAQRIAARFYDQPRVYAGNLNREPAAEGGFSGPFERSVRPDPDHPAYAGAVAVLMGPRNMSSCEAFLLMMRQVPRCTLVGMRSFGSTGNPKPIELPNGVAVMLPSWQGLRADGTCYEGEGIAPDVEVATTPADFRNADPVLQRAIEVLGEQSAEG